MQTIISESRSIIILEGLKRERDIPSPSSTDLDDIRANVEKAIGPEENLFRIDWVCAPSALLSIESPAA